MTEWPIGDRLFDVALIVGSFGVPLIGCVLAVVTGHWEWLWLLTPLLIYMEGGIALGLMAIFGVTLATWIIR